MALILGKNTFPESVMLPVEDCGLAKILQCDCPPVFLKFGLKLFRICFVGAFMIFLVSGTVVIKVDASEF